MDLKANLLAVVALASVPSATFAQFTDPFNSIDPAWTVNRYAPAGFASVVFNGDSRLQLTINQTGSTANRPPTFSDPFYDIQGMQRPGGITGLWSLSAQVYVSSAFDTTTGALASSALWGHTGTTPAGGAYAVLGFTNASPTDPLNPNALDRAFTFEVFNVSTGGWIALVAPSGFAFDSWHTLSETSTGTAFHYFIDDTLVFSQATTAGNDLMSAMIQGYNFDGTGDHSYSVYWDNITASAIPEPAGTVLIAATGALGLAFWRRRRTT
jgi:hypothetical protein